MKSLIPENIFLSPTIDILITNKYFLIFAGELAKIKFLKSRKKPTLSDVLKFTSLNVPNWNISSIRKTLFLSKMWWNRGRSSHCWIWNTIKYYFYYKLCKCNWIGSYYFLWTQCHSNCCSIWCTWCSIFKHWKYWRTLIFSLPSFMPTLW